MHKFWWWWHQLSLHAPAVNKKGICGLPHHLGLLSYQYYLHGNHHHVSGGDDNFSITWVALINIIIINMIILYRGWWWLSVNRPRSPSWQQLFMKEIKRIWLLWWWFNIKTMITITMTHMLIYRDELIHDPTWHSRVAVFCCLKISTRFSKL